MISTRSILLMAMSIRTSLKINGSSSCTPALDLLRHHAGGHQVSPRFGLSPLVAKSISARMNGSSRAAIGDLYPAIERGGLLSSSPPN